MRARSFVGTFTCITFVAIACAPAQTQAPSANSLTQEAHRLAKTAKTLEQFTEALRACGRAMKASPAPEQKSYIQKLAGWTYNKRGEALAALADQTAETDTQRAAEYERAAVNDFGLAIRFDPSSWKPRFNRAVNLAMSGDYDNALLDLEFVLRVQPKHQNALFNRAEILLQQGEYDRAVADYTKVIEIDPTDGAAYAGRGIALSALGDGENALLDLNAVVRLEPESAAAYVDRADLYAALGNWERAAGDYRVAISLDKTKGRAYQNVAWLMATCPDEKYRNSDLAVRAAKKAIQLDGETYLGLDTLAAALASHGLYTEASATQKKAITAAPEQEKASLSQRLSVYQSQRPYIERVVDSKVRLATAENNISSE